MKLSQRVVGVILSFVLVFSQASGVVTARAEGTEASPSATSSTVPPSVSPTSPSGGDPTASVSSSASGTQTDSPSPSDSSSATAPIAVGDIIAPTAPANLKSSATETTITINWTASTDNVGVTSYDIYRDGTKINSVLGDITYTDKSLDPNTTYKYVIKANDAVGNASAASSELAVTTLPDQSAPSIPANLTYSSHTTDSITLFWTASTDNVGVTGYDIYRDGQKIGNSPSATYTDSELTVSSFYTYAVVAVDGSGNASNASIPVNLATANPTGVTDPTVPGVASSSTITQDTINISWAASNDSLGISKYYIFRDGYIVGSTSDTSYSDTKLTAGTIYTYTIRSQDNSGYISESSIPISFYTINPENVIAPAAPMNIMFTASIDSTITMTWTAPTDTIGISGYYILRNGVYIGNTQNTSFTDVGLTFSSIYSYTVQAKNNSGYISDPSGSLSFTTKNPDGSNAPTSPTNVTCPSKTDTTADISWTALTDSSGISNYYIFRNGSYIGDATDTNYSDTGLTVGNTYKYSIIAQSKSGNISDASAELSVTITANSTTSQSSLAGKGATSSQSLMQPMAGDTTPPTTTITVPASNAYVNGTITVTGTASDTNMNSWTLEYGAGSSPSSWTTINTGTTNVTNGTLGSWNTSSLTNGSVYTLRLRATDKSNNSNSTTKQVTKDATSPTIAMTAPDDNSYITGTITVTGTASDSHISSWTLDYGLGSSPSTWTTINSGTSSVTNGTLGSWNTSSLTNGSLYTLRLRVTDLAGNTSQMTKHLTKDGTAPTATITLPASNARVGGAYNVTGTASDANISFWELEYGVGTSPFSWNGIDEGTVSITNGTLSTWYMSSLTNGSVYTLRLTVTDQAGNTSRATRQITKDSTVLPTTDMWSPDDGSNVTGTVAVTGTVSDMDLSNWTLEYGLGSDPSSWTTINTGTASITGGTLGNWNTNSLTNGSQYRLRLRATDAAGNYNDTTKLLTKNGTAPVTTITVPANNAHIGGAYTVKGTASDPNLTSWILDYGQGASPSTWNEIDEGTTSITNGTLSTWYMSSLTEGTVYTLRLSATNSSGGSNQTMVQIIKDSTALPTTDMWSPDDGSTISGTVTVTGTVSDTDISSWTLEYGLGSSPSSWTTINSGTTSVTGGTLGSWNTSSLTAGSQYRLRLRATDSAGNYNQTTKLLTKGGGVPTTSITVPANNAYINGTITVTGTASDANMSSWTLDYGAGTAPSSWTTINTGTTSVTNGTLGSWNTSSLTNGSVYTLRLRATNSSSNTNQTTVQVTKDSTLPTATITTPSINSYINGTITVTGTASDANITSWTLDYGAGTTPSSWTTINTGTASVTNGTLGSWNTGSLTDGSIYTLRLRDTDAAGNANQTTVQVTKDSTLPVATITAPANNANVSGTVTVTGTASDMHISNWTLDYGLGSSPSSWTTINTGSASITGGTLGSWDTSSLTSGSVYTLRIRATDLAGNSNQSTIQVIKMIAGPTTIISAPANNAHIGGTYTVTGTVSDQSLSSWVLEYGQGTSPTTWTQINTGTTSVTGGTLGTWYTSSLTDGIVYTVRLRATNTGGGSNQTTVQITKDSAVLPVLSIAAPNNNSYINGTVTVSGTVSDTDLSSWILEYGLGSDPSSWTTINSGTASVSGGTLGSWNTGSLSDGSLYRLRLRATDSAGNYNQTTKLLTKDSALPNASIASPSKNSFINGTITVYGTASDSNISSWTLEYGAGTSPSTWTQINTGTTSVTGDSLGSWNTSALTDGSSYTLRLRTSDLAGNTNQTTVSVTKDSTLPVTAITAPTNNTCLKGTITVTGTASDVHISSWTLEYGLGTSPSFWTTINSGTTSITSGTLGSWDTSGLTDGTVYTLRIRSTDAAGNMNLATTQVNIDSTIPLTTLSIPGNTFINGTTIISGTVSDANMSSWTLDYGVGTSPSSWTTINTGTSSITDGALGTWYVGSLTNGSVYTLRLKATDTANNANQTTVQVTIDITVPVTTITAPSNNSNLNGTVTVTGTASDANMSSWTLDYGAGASPTSWTTINTGTSSVTNGTLGSWDTSALSDDLYSLRLRAVDAAGNMNETTKQIMLDSTVPIVSIFEPVSSYVNGIVSVYGTASDLNLSSWTLDYGTGLYPTSWTQIYTGTDTVTGGTLSSWNTNALADGSTYTLRLRATDTAGNTDQTTLWLTKDSTPPTASISSPLDDTFANRTVTITGTASDSHISSWTLDYGSGTSPLSWININGDAASNINSALGSLNTSLLSDGQYTIRLRVADEASNVSQTTAIITVDSTIPATGITVPTNDSYISGTVSISGTASDTNVSSWELEYGNGTTPLTWTQINTGTTSITSGTIASWNTSSLTDGIYTLRLRSEDKAGNTNQATIQVTKDETQPTTTITSPENNARVKGAIIVTGTASDKNLTNWTLEYGSGDSPSAWTQINMGTVSITSDTLGTLDTTALTDGVYTLRLCAKDSAKNLKQTDVKVTVDSVQPIVSIDSPSDNSYVSGSVSVIGTVTDANINSWTLEYGVGTTPLNWTQINTGKISITSETLGSIDTSALADGIYTLRLSVLDLAGNTSQTTAQVVVDSTLPVTNISLPAGSYVNGAVMLTGTASDVNLSSWALDYGLGMSPSSWSQISMGTTSVTEGILGSWDTSTLLADSVYTLRIRAIDSAGNTSQTTTWVKKEAAVQSAIISTPMDYAFVKGTVTFTGTAYYENLNNWVLEYGSGASPSSWAQIETGTTSVKDSTLGTLDTTALADGLYTVQLHATDAALNTGTAVIHIIVDNTPPSKPNGLIKTNRTHTSVIFSWTESTESNGIAEYDIYRNGIQIGQTPYTFYSDNGLLAGTAYSYTIKAKDNAGNISDVSDDLNTSTVDITVPASVSAIPHTTAIDITWDEVDSAQSYDVKVNDDIFASVMGTSYTYRGLNPGQTYTISVRAVIQGIEQNWSDAFTGYTNTCTFISYRNISCNTTWTKDDSPYIINPRGTLIIPQNLTLTVEPGTVVKLAKDLDIQIQGTLTAIGSSSEPVIFTSITDPEYGGDGSEERWWGFAVLHTGEMNADHVEMRYGGLGVAQNKLNLTNSKIYQCGGFSLGFGDNLEENHDLETSVNIENNTFYSPSNPHCGAIYVGTYTHSSINIENNIFNNTGFSCIYVDHFDTGNLLIRNNEFSNTTYGVYNWEPYNNIDARYNYWGSDNGPSTDNNNTNANSMKMATANASSYLSGSKVTSGVLYNPYNQAAAPSSDKTNPPNPPSGTIHADPVDTTTGSHIIHLDALGVNGAQDLALELSYTSSELTMGTLGKGWSHNYEVRLETQEDGSILVYWTPSKFTKFTPTALGSNTYTTDSFSEQNEKITQNVDGTYLLNKNNDVKYTFNSFGQLSNVQDKTGLNLAITHDTDGDLVILDPVSGKYLKVTYTNGLATSVEDQSGRTAQFHYNDIQCLDQITDASGKTTSFTYDGSGHVLTSTDGDGKLYFTDTYDSSGRIASQDDAIEGNGLTYFNYDNNSDTGETTVTITDRNGHASVNVFDSKKQLVSATDENGHTKLYSYDDRGNIVSETDENGNTTMYTYDSNNNMLTSTDPASSITIRTYDANNNLLTQVDPGGGTTTYTYDANNRVTSMTDTRGNITTFNYDSNGLLTEKAIGNRHYTYTFENGMVKTETNPSGGVKTYTFNEAGQPLTITDANGGVTTYTYDADGNKLSETDPLGNTVSYTYDSRRNILTKTDAKGNVTTYQYNGNGKIIAESDAQGNVKTYEYDGEDRLIKTTDAQGNVIHTTYAAAGGVLSKTDANGKTTSYTYDANGNVLTTTKPQDGITTSTYYSNGKLKTQTDAAGHTSSYYYNSSWKISRVTNAEGKDTVYEYSPSGDLLSVTDPLGHSTSYTYDLYGNMLTITDPNGNVTEYTYNSNNQITSIKDALGHETTYTYDVLGRLESTTDARGNTTTSTYDSVGRLILQTDVLGHTKSKEYDANGNVVKVTDANNHESICTTYSVTNLPETVKDALGNQKTYTYDSLGRLTKTTDPMSHDTVFGYSANGQITTVTDALDGDSSNTYDEDGNIIAVKGPADGETDYTFDTADRLISESTTSGGSITYGYNALNLVNEQTNARGQTRTYTFDDAGRIASFTDAEGTTSYTYDNNGNVLTVTDAAGTITREFNALNRVTEYTDVNGNVIQYTYDAVGNLSAITYPGNKTVNYAYDAANRLSTVTDWDNRVTFYTYDAANNLMQTTRPDGSVLTQTYDAANRLTAMNDADANNNVINTYVYTYDADGHVTTESSSNGQITSTITYDVLGRVTGRVDKDSNNNVINQYSYSYDAAGNITSGTVNNQTVNMTYDANNRLATYNGQAVTYDADGNMTNGPLGSSFIDFSYDSGNRLIQAGGTAYTYDALNNRISATTNGTATKYVYDDVSNSLSRLLISTVGGNSTYYIYGNGLIGQETSDGTYSVYHYDLRGSTTALTNLQGVVMDAYTYDPYGRLGSHSGSSNTPFQYNGRDGVMTDGNGLYYQRARYYNLDSLRFINADTKKGSIKDSTSLNNYAFVNGNPVMMIDPHGTSSEPNGSNFDYKYKKYNGQYYFINISQHLGNLWRTGFGGWIPGPLVEGHLEVDYIYTGEKRDITVLYAEASIYTHYVTTPDWVFLNDFYIDTFTVGAEEYNGTEDLSNGYFKKENTHLDPTSTVDGLAMVKPTTMYSYWWYKYKTVSFHYSVSVSPPDQDIFIIPSSGGEGISIQL